MHGSVTGDGDLDGGGCASPDQWCRGKPQICDDSIWQCVGYVGCDPDCVDQAVPEGSDEYPFRMLICEPLCVIADDITYKENIEALSGTIYDYDDVNDTTQGYFDYDDPRDYELWCGWDDLGDDGMYHDPYRSDVTNDETVVSRAWLGVQSDGTLAAPELTVTEVTDQSPSPKLDRKPGVPSSGSDKVFVYGHPVTGRSRGWRTGTLGLLATRQTTNLRPGELRGLWSLLRRLLMPTFPLDCPSGLLGFATGCGNVPLRR